MTEIAHEIPDVYPTLGRIVHYVEIRPAFLKAHPDTSDARRWRAATLPAIVTYVGANGFVDLQVFGRHSVWSVHAVRFLADPQEDSWHWPAR